MPKRFREFRNQMYNRGIAFQGNKKLMNYRRDVERHVSNCLARSGSEKNGKEEQTQGRFPSKLYARRIRH